MREYEQTDKHGSRVEHRRLCVTDRINGYLDWPGVGQVCRVERTRTEFGQTSSETSYAITSLIPSEAGAKELHSIWRGHWQIENSLHYVRDVTFREDACRVSGGSSPQLLAALRNAIVSLFHIEGVKNCASAIREYTWNPVKTAGIIGIK